MWSVFKFTSPAVCNDIKLVTAHIFLRKDSILFRESLETLRELNQVYKNPVQDI
jgi:hypothetical protein